MQPAPRAMYPIASRILFTLACGSAAACSSITELVVAVDTDLRPVAEFERLDVVAEGPSGSPQTASAQFAADAALAFPATVVLSPRASVSGAVSVTSSLSSASGMVARSSVTTAFLDGRSLLLSIDLLRTCGVCPAGERCAPSGECSGQSQVNPGSLPAFDGSLPPSRQGQDLCVAELCNGLDDDCDGRFDEAFDLLTDSQNCGACGVVCPSQPTNECRDAICVAKTVVAVAAGTAHTCVRRFSGAVTCWGLNNTGALGTNDMLNRGTPDDVVDLADATEVGAGNGYSCALRQTGEARCWGDSANGKLGAGDTNPRLVPAPVVGLTGVETIATGSQHACAVAAGAASCWGANAHGQLGSGNTVPTNQPVPVMLPAGVSLTQIAAGDRHTCAVAVGGDVYCWGGNSAGQLGSAPGGDQTAPTAAVVGLPQMQRVAAGARHTCAQAVSGDVYCWGDNADGQLGDGTQTGRGTVGSPILTAATALALSAEGNTSCAVGTAATVTGPFCWGAGASGQLGDGASQGRLSPSPVTLDRTVTRIAVGGAHACALSDRAEVFCWGSNRDGQLGLGPVRGPDQPTPQAVVGLY